METSSHPERRLLVLACSARKSESEGLLPAWERYDGQLYRVCKRLQREGRWPGDLLVRILSAQHGLISPGEPIAWYDRRMTVSRAQQLRLQVGRALDLTLAGHPILEVYLALGRTYAAAVRGLFPSHLHVAHGGDTIGRMQARLRDWITSTETRA